MLLPHLDQRSFLFEHVVQGHGRDAHGGRQAHCHADEVSPPRVRVIQIRERRYGTEVEDENGLWTMSSTSQAANGHWAIMKHPKVPRACQDRTITVQMSGVITVQHTFNQRPGRKPSMSSMPSKKGSTPNTQPMAMHSKKTIHNRTASLAASMFIIWNTYIPPYNGPH